MSVGEDESRYAQDLEYPRMSANIYSAILVDRSAKDVSRLERNALDIATSLRYFSEMKICCHSLAMLLREIVVGPR